MAAIEYRVFFNNTPATREQLARIEDIIVEQEIDMMWEARVDIPVCVNGDGRWEGEDEAWMRPFNRLRIEVRIGLGDFTPLIDGPIIGYDTARSALPGKSIITVIARDDSVYLNRNETIARFEGQLDSQIARQIFSETEALAASPPDIPRETDPQPGALPSDERQRDTQMKFLRRLARRHGDWHAYVLPGRSPGASIGAFRQLPTEPDGLPPMILLGKEQNLRTFTVRNNQQRQANVAAASLSITDKGITSATASYRDAQFMGETPAASGSVAERRLAPGLNDTADQQSAADGAARRSRYVSDATGSVIPHCYQGVLSPYRVVTVRISDSNLSSNYLITKVTHKLTRSTYTQDFSAMGDSVTTAPAAGGSVPQGSGSISASINVQGGIF